LVPLTKSPLGRSRPWLARRLQTSVWHRGRRPPRLAATGNRHDHRDGRLSVRRRTCKIRPLYLIKP
jgi:hypothetical protein